MGFEAGLALIFCMVVEAYYTAAELATLLKFSKQWVVNHVLCGDFGVCVRIGAGRTADYRVPASGVNAWIKRNAVLGDVAVEPVLARSAGELRRKLSDEQ